MSPNPRWTTGAENNNVDDIEDAKSREFQKVQQGSIAGPHLIETEYVENRALFKKAEICLGHRGSHYYFQ
jgi:hypothetical protein